MSILIIALIVVVAIVVVAIVMKSKKKKGGELMAQQPASEPQSPAQPTPEDTSSNMGDSNSQPQI